MPDVKNFHSADARDQKYTRRPGLKTVWAFFCRQDVQLLIFAVFFTALSWPFLTIANSKAPFFRLLAYFFGVWLAMIVMLFIICHSLRKNCAPQSSADRQEGS